ncbi:MAG: M14 family murein peptide amidase A [Mariprofundales bacterium]
MNPVARRFCLLTLSFLSAATTASAGYYTIPEQDSVRAQCARIGHKLGSVSRAECLTSGLTVSDGYSANGQVILLREYPPLARRQPKARVLLLGGVHGDEFASVSVVFKWMHILKRHHSGRFHWHIVPLANPDGLLQRHSQRINGHQVDLNRNLPTPDWQRLSQHYWVKRTRRDPRRYPGAKAASEAETQWLMREITDFQPDVIISVHAPYGILDFDGPPKGPHHLGYLYAHALGTYPGSLGNYAGVVRHIPVITMELPRAGIMPTNQQIHRMWIDIVRWIDHHIPKQETAHFRAPTSNRARLNITPATSMRAIDQ